MAIRTNWTIIGLVLFPIPSFGIFPSNAELRCLVMKIIKGNPFYKNHSNQHNSKGLHTIFMPFGYVDQDIKTLLFYLINIPSQWNEQPSLLYQPGCPCCPVVFHAFPGFPMPCRDFPRISQDFPCLPGISQPFQGFFKFLAEFAFWRQCFFFCIIAQGKLRGREKHHAQPWPYV